MINIDSVIKRHNGFFAFNNEQFKEGINKDLIPYINIGAGGFVPKKNYSDFIKDCEAVKQDKIKKTKSKKTNYKIAFDLFMNYELQYSDLEDEHVRTLEDDYNIKPADTEKYFVRFMSYCLNNDLI